MRLLKHVTSKYIDEITSEDTILIVPVLPVSLFSRKSVRKNRQSISGDVLPCLVMFNTKIDWPRVVSVSNVYTQVLYMSKYDTWYQVYIYIYIYIPGTVRNINTAVQQ